jgi:transcriptional regulator with XRE-family HTH domain
MGTKPRPKPARLAEKVLHIRNALGLSQTEMLRRLGVENTIAYHRISEYETGKREPPLMVILAYARSVNLSTDYLIDDELNLPQKLPEPSRRPAT